MTCRNCHQEVSKKEIRCPHCGTEVRMNPVAKLFKGWGIIDLFLIMIAVIGIVALVYVYFGKNFHQQQDAWKVEAQAFEETLGQVKVVGVVKNMTPKAFNGSISLDLRVYDSKNKLVYEELAATPLEAVEPLGEVPFSFLIQRPKDMAYFNVKAANN